MNRNTHRSTMLDESDGNLEREINLARKRYYVKIRKQMTENNKLRHGRSLSLWYTHLKRGTRKNSYKKFLLLFLMILLFLFFFSFPNAFKSTCLKQRWWASLVQLVIRWREEEKKCNNASRFHFNKEIRTIITPRSL